MCHYEWGTGGNADRRSFLNISVSPMSKAFPGTDASLVRQLLARVKAGTTDTSVIPGVGDTHLPIRRSDQDEASRRWRVKGNMLIVSFESSNARAKKDQVIVLLKAAAGRLLRVDGSDSNQLRASQREQLIVLRSGWTSTSSHGVRRSTCTSGTTGSVSTRSAA